jgi:predicted Co/Zn/Cd cation transporter (cation efflux family)
MLLGQAAPRQIPQHVSRHVSRHVSQQRRGLTAIDAITALVVILLVVQVWLLSATLDAFLAGRAETALPGAVISGVLFAACLAMYGFVRRVDRDARSGH